MNEDRKRLRIWPEAFAAVVLTALIGVGGVALGVWWKDRHAPAPMLPQTPPQKPPVTRYFDGEKIKSLEQVRSLLKFMLDGKVVQYSPDDEKTAKRVATIEGLLK